MPWSLQMLEELPEFPTDLPYLWPPVKLCVFSHDMWNTENSRAIIWECTLAAGITHEAGFCHSAYQHFPLCADYSDIPPKDNTTIFSSVSAIQASLPFMILISFAALTLLVKH